MECYGGHSTYYGSYNSTNKKVEKIYRERRSGGNPLDEETAISCPSGRICGALRDCKPIIDQIKTGLISTVDIAKLACGENKNDICCPKPLCPSGRICGALRDCKKIIYQIKTGLIFPSDIAKLG